MRIQQFLFRPGPTQTSLCMHRRWLEAGNFGLKKKRNCTIRVAYCTADLRLCFAYADCWFSHAAVHIKVGFMGVYFSWTCFPDGDSLSFSVFVN